MTDDKAIGPDLTRRSVIGLAGSVLAVAAAWGPVAIAQSVRRVTPSDLVMMDAVSLAGAIRARRVSCVEVMTAYLDHIERWNPSVNAIVALQARAASGSGRCMACRTPSRTCNRFGGS